MAIKLYMDHNVHKAITDGLKLRDIDVITCYQDGTTDWDDYKLLNRAFDLGRVLFTYDDDHLVEAAKRQRENTPFFGVIYIHQDDVVIRKCMDDLEIILKSGEPKDFMNQIIFL